MNDFITLDTLRTWVGMTLTVYTIVAVWKSFFKRKLENNTIRTMAFFVGLALLLFVAVAEARFTSPWLSVANFLVLGYTILNAFSLVIGTAGVHKLYKDAQGEPLEPLLTDESQGAPSENLVKKESVQASTTAPIGDH